MVSFNRQALVLGPLLLLKRRLCLVATTVYSYSSLRSQAWEKPYRVSCTYTADSSTSTAVLRPLNTDPEYQFQYYYCTSTSYTYVCNVLIRQCVPTINTVPAL